MANEKLFTAIYIPETPFVNGVLKPKKAKKYNFELSGNKKMVSNLYHFVYKRDEKQIHCYYFEDLEDDLLRYLFVENNDLYDDFVSQFRGGGQRYWESGMDVYLDVDSPDEVFEHLNHVYNNSFYDEDEPMPLCHIFGQQMWHSNASLIANRTALLELKEAIDVALKQTRLGLMPSDGEGYDLFIKCVEDNFEWEELEMPYHDRECYVPDETVGLPPNKTFKKYKL
ncbi:hypothetical protein AB4X15_21400 [Peribacillus simplex]|uniref:hypothetical protein n=1 Tax=Peribacillus TaxID=2675229 RepID=UPI00315DBFF6